MTQEEVDKAISMRESGMKASEISRELGYSSSAIERLLKKNGYINTGNSILISKEEDALIRKLYIKEGMNAKEVWESHFTKKCAKTYIEKYIRKGGFSRGMGAGKRNKSLRHDYFDNIDSPDKAYILGNIYADASVSSGNARNVRFMVAERDRDLLEYIKEETNSDCEIKTSSRGEVYMSLYSQYMVDSLKRYNIVKNKQSIDNGLPEIPKDYMRDFIRGYFDGDGTVYQRKGRKGYFVSICCTKTFAEELREVLLVEGIYDNMTDSQIVDMSKYGSNIHHVRIYNYNDIDRFAKYIYRDGFFSLRRKKRRFSNHINRQANTEITCGDTQAS